MPKFDLNKVGCNFIEIAIWHGYSPANFLHIFSSAFKEIWKAFYISLLNLTHWNRKQTNLFIILIIKPFTARKTIFSFSKCSEKIVFPKQSRWNMIFLVILSGKMIFFFPKIWSYSLDGKWKMIFLEKIHGNMTFSSNAPKRWSFQKKIALKYDLSCCIIWKDDNLFFPKIFFRRKMKDDISQENTRKYNIFLKCSEKMVFLKQKSCWNMIFLVVLSGKMIFLFSRKYSLDGKWKMIFLKKIWGNIIFSWNAPKRWSF